MKTGFHHQHLQYIHLAVLHSLRFQVHHLLYTLWSLRKPHATPSVCRVGETSTNSPKDWHRPRHQNLAFWCLTWSHSWTECSPRCSAGSPIPHALQLQVLSLWWLPHSSWSTYSAPRWVHSLWSGCKSSRKLEEIDYAVAEGHAGWVHHHI